MNHFQLEWLLRLAASVLCGALIGYERYNKAKEAGIRTHAVVALGSTLLMIISIHGFPDANRFDASRVAAQVVSGIGFLGAGMIFIHKGSIQGLSTAAGIWITAAIGMALGNGMYLLDFSTTVFTLIVQGVFPMLFSYYPPRTTMKIRVHMRPSSKLDIINDYLAAHSYNHSENNIRSDANGGWIVDTEIISHKQVEPELLISEMQKDPDILSVEIL